VPEADDHGLAEVPGAVDEGAWVTVVPSRSDGRHEDVGRIPPHNPHRAGLADGLGEQCRERLSPAAVVPDEPGLPAHRLCEVRDRPIVVRLTTLVAPILRGRARRQRRLRHPRPGRARCKAMIAAVTAATEITTAAIIARRELTSSCYRKTDPVEAIARLVTRWSAVARAADDREFMPCWATSQPSAPWLLRCWNRAGWGRFLLRNKQNAPTIK